MPETHIPADIHHTHTGVLNRREKGEETAGADVHTANINRSDGAARRVLLECTAGSPRAYSVPTQCLLRLACVTTRIVSPDRRHHGPKLLRDVARPVTTVGLHPLLRRRRQLVPRGREREREGGRERERERERGCLD